MLNDSPKIHVKTVISLNFLVKQEKINEVVAKAPVVAVVGVVVSVLTVPTVGVVKLADVPVVLLVVLAIVSDSVGNVVGVVPLSTRYTQNRKKIVLTNTFDNTTNTQK